MPYQAEISRENPSAILFLLDQSWSMNDPFGGSSQGSKADRLADALNRVLNELTIRCTRDQDEGVRYYYDVGIIGYGATVGSALGGNLARRDLVSIRDIADNPLRIDERAQQIEDGAGGLVQRKIKFPVWVEAKADNGTPMEQAIDRGRSLLEPWVAAHQESFPPIVINITDGEANPDENPVAGADRLKSLATTDGGLLLFNLHLSSTPAPSILYPGSDRQLPDEFAQKLFTMSSVLPSHMQQAATGKGYAVGSESRGFVFNADIVEVITFLDIGTRPKYMR